MTLGSRQDRNFSPLGVTLQSTSDQRYQQCQRVLTEDNIVCGAAGGAVRKKKPRLSCSGAFKGADTQGSADELKRAQVGPVSPAHLQ